MGRFLSMIGAVIAILPGVYFGQMAFRYIDLYTLLFLGTLIAGCWWLASKTLTPDLKSIAPVVGVAGGQLAAGVISFILLGVGLFVADVVVLLIGVIWLIKRPGRAPVVLLIVYEVLSLLITTAGVMSSEAAFLPVPTLISGMLRNLFSLIVMSIALYNTKSTMPRSTVTSSGADTGPGGPSRRAG
jgi:hypothetical protein